MANEIYPVSWWGSPVQNGWGGIYYDYTDPTISEYQERVLADGGTIEAIECLKSNLNLIATPSIAMIPSGYKDGKVYSVLPNISDGDFDFIRGSAATRVNAQGLVENVQIISSELVSNGNFSQGSQDWTISSSASVGENKLNVDASAFNFFATQTALTNGLNYKVTLDAEVTNGDILLYTGTQFDTINSSDSYTFYITSDSAQIRFRSGGSGFEGSITNISVKEITDDTSLPRLDYSDGSCPSLLLEPQSTNLYLNSEILSTQSNATSASTYTVSFYGTGTITFSGTHTGNLVGTGTGERVSATFTTTSGTLLSTVSGTCIKGQLENLSDTTSYIPTKVSIATRLADVATIDLSGFSLTSITETINGVDQTPITIIPSTYTIPYGRINKIIMI